MNRSAAAFFALLFGLVLGPTAALSDEAAGTPASSEAAATEETVGHEEAAATRPMDPLTAHLQAEVTRYYRGIGAEATADELDRGLQTLSFMLLDGVSLARIEAAIDTALGLHSPGRRVPFEVAVPLRVQPAAASPNPSETSPSTQSSAPETTTAQPTPKSGEEAGVDASAQEELSGRQQQTEMKRNRLRLYKQWRSRTRGKRALISLGIPLLAAGYAMGFGVSGSLNIFGQLPQSWAWVSSVPVVGTLLLGIWTEGLYPGFFALSVIQITGAAFLVGGILIKANWPYDKDPTALHIGTKRGGGPALTLRAGSSGTGGWISGRF